MRHLPGYLEGAVDLHVHCDRLLAHDGPLCEAS
jgi:hypothetical protein